MSPLGFLLLAGASSIAFANVFVYPIDHAGAIVDSCPVCGATTYAGGGCSGYTLRTLGDLIVHYNNDHGWGWLDLANKVELPAGGA